MKTFVRHLRTRAILRPSRNPKTNLTEASIPTATSQSPTLTHPPTIPIPSPPKPNSLETLTRYCPPTSFSTPVRTALQENYTPPPALPTHPHRQYSPLQEYDREEYEYEPEDPPEHRHPRIPKESKEPRTKTQKLHISDIVPEGITRYAYRWETLTPSTDQLKNADTFFLKYPPKHLWSEAKFKKIDFGNVPEVAFLGRSNVGKSSLLNALLNNKNLAYTSSKPGRTRLMNAFSIADGKLVLLDMPGYGHASREEWGVQIMKYLKSRKQFRRAFLLIDAKHGLKQSDLQLLEQFGQEGISFQIVLSKIDRVKPDEVAKLFQEVRDLMENGIPGANAGLGEILATAGDPARKGEKKVGLSDLRWAVMISAGLESVYT